MEEVLIGFLVGREVGLRVVLIGFLVGREVGRFLIGFFVGLRVGLGVFVKQQKPTWAPGGTTH